MKRENESLNTPDNPGTLFVVATPIGHLDDLTRRAEHVLRQVQIIAAEDTRRTAGLLAHIGHTAPQLVALHDHNEAGQSERLIQDLLNGQDVAVVSDAGTPLINDPGFKLVQLAQAAGIPCTPIPGCSSVITALSVCPLPCQIFTYLGFIPSKTTAAEQFLTDALQTNTALVMFETPHRINRTLAQLANLTSRRLMLARELTKQYETLYVGTAEDVAAELGDNPKGEMVLIIEASDEQPIQADHQLVLEVLSEELAPSKASKAAARLLNISRSEAYELIMALRPDA